MKLEIATAVALAGPALYAAYKFVVKPILRSKFDDPKTPQDESDVFDPLADALIKKLLEFARSQGKEPNGPAIAKKVSRKFPGITLEEAIKRVDFLGRK